MCRPLADPLTADPRLTDDPTLTDEARSDEPLTMSSYPRVDAGVAKARRDDPAAGPTGVPEGVKTSNSCLISNVVVESGNVDVQVPAFRSAGAEARASLPTSLRCCLVCSS